MARLLQLLKGEQTMKITLPNGLVLEGTPEQVQSTAKTLGFSLPGVSGLGDGTYYNSSSKGYVKITEMQTTHLRNALLKYYKEWIDGLYTKTDQEVYQAIRTGITDRTWVNMFLEYGKRRI